MYATIYLTTTIKTKEINLYHKKKNDYYNNTTNANKIKNYNSQKVELLKGKPLQ